MKGCELSAAERDILHSNVGKYLKGKDPLMNKGFIALTTFDEAEEKFYILAGGSKTDSRIKIENLDDTFTDGDSFSVKISYVDYKGLGGAVNAPIFSEIKNVTVRGQSIAFTVPCERESQAFFIEITKGESEGFENPAKTLRYEAESVELSEGTVVSASAYSVSEGLCVKGITREASVTFNVNVPRKGEYRLDMVYGNMNTGETGRESIDVEVAYADSESTVRCPSTVKEDCMECVSLVLELAEGNNKITISPANDDVLVLDFIDITEKSEEKVYSEKLSARNVTEDNAYFIIAPSDGYYKLSGLADDKKITINGIEMKGNGDGIFYFGRGYNKIVLPEGVSFSSAELLSQQGNDFIITPDDVTVIGEATVEENGNVAKGKHIGWISSDKESGVEFNVNVSSDGYYAFTIEYANNEEGGYHDYNVDLVERYISVFLDEEKQGNYFFRSTYSWDNYKTKTIVLKLHKGENIVKLINDGSYSFNNKVTYAPNIGNIKLNSVS